MARIFSFEREIHATLELVPLAVRRKLDLAGLKLSLAGWQALPIADRRALAKESVEGDDDASLAAFSATLRAAAAHAGVAPTPPPSPRGSGPGRAPAVPPSLRARVVALHAALDDATWRGLPDDDRYALLKLADAKHDPERLGVALAELGVAFSAV